MVKSRKWTRPAHHASVIYAGVLSGNANAASYPGLDFQAPMNAPVGYESDFLQHIGLNPAYSELRAMIANKGLELGTDILTVADLKNKVCPEIACRNAVEEAFSAYMIDQLDNE